MPCDVVVVEIYVSSFQLDGDEDRPFLLNLSSLLAVWTEGVVVDDPSFQRESERESHPYINHALQVRIVLRWDVPCHGRISLEWV